MTIHLVDEQWIGFCGKLYPNEAVRAVYENLAPVDCQECLHEYHKRQIEHAAARATVEQWGVEAIWVAPTPEGAVLRAHYALLLGASITDVERALELSTPRH